LIALAFSLGLLLDNFTDKIFNILVRGIVPQKALHIVLHLGK
jgi:hypothetical protein